MISFKQYFEGTVAGDVAGTGNGFTDKHPDDECPCKFNPDSEECKQHRHRKHRSNLDEVFITRLVNDAKKKLKKMGFNNLKYLNFRDYDLSKENFEEIPCSHSGYTIYLVKRKDGAFFDVLPSGTF